ncbi:MAG: tetratricopeptide repeat protein, partial [Candidatus Contendobacter sp.]|nr:tetratricopeptide repeat protein [Candidatus Contendobacter sp.]
MTRPISRCIGVVLLIIGLLLGQPGYPTPDPVPTIVSAPVAVFPLHNATGDAGLDWVSIGLQDSLTVDLWYVSALHTQALPQMTESLRQVCPDPTLACVAGQDWATWQGPAKAQGYGGFLWGEYRRDGEALVLRLGWYGSEGATPLAEQTVRGSSLPELLTASSAGLQALLAARAIPLTDAEQARLRAPKTKVAAAWEQNALGYWEQIRHTLAADDAQRTVRAAAWEQHLRAAVQADPDYAEAWNNLGWQRYTMKIYKGEGAALSPTLGADVAFQQALRLKPEMIDALMGRGNALKAQEKPAEALPWYERAVALNPSLVGHRWVLLDAYLTAKRPEAGLAQLTVLDEHLKRHGRETERQALNDWRGRYHEALQQWPQALAAYAVWDADLARQGDTAREPRLEIAQRLDAVGKTLTDQNQFKDAEAYQRRALAIREAVQGPDHLDVARSLRVLAELLQKQQRASEAEPLLQRADALWNAQRAALAVKQQQMGWEQLQGIAREWWQAFFDQNTDKPEVVLTLLEELSKRQATLDEFFQVYVESKANNVPEILQALDRRRTEAEADRLSETGGTLYQQGRYQEAEELYRRALAIREQALGPDHPGTAASLNNLAVVLNAQGRLADAEALHRRALAIMEKALGPNHPDT